MSNTRIVVGVGAALGLALTLVAGCSPRDAAAVENRKGKGEPPKPLVCPQSTTTQPKPPANPGARQAAQHGLRFLTAAANAWTSEHKCFGCHVQAVTMEALTVGVHHQYDVGAKDLDAMVAALELGVTAGGHVTGAAFEGQAWARYDAWVDARHTPTLLKYSTQLLGFQQADGAVPDDDARRPITGGTMQTTYQAMQTWRQAFARTADDKWLAPMRKAERYLATRSTDWTTTSDVYLQDANFALLGLLAAGAGPGERSAEKLQRLLLSRQHQDGGWGLDATASDALATGQTLYALRLAGHGDGEAAIDRGIAWLVQHQVKDGGWHTLTSSQGGADKGEAMWAVLGLVAMDVTSLAVNGLTDGQHVTPMMAISISAHDNQAAGVAKVEMFVDDDPIAGACASTLAYAWNTAGLSEGKHTVDIVATNTTGKVSRRRYEVYAGNTYLTELGTRFDEGTQATEIALRNLAPTPATAGTVELAVFATSGANNVRGERVFGTTSAGTPGAMTFAWNGTGADGKPRPRGRYIAELAFHDVSGKVIQRIETLFLQDTEAAQRAAYGEIEGQLSIAPGTAAAGTSANTEIELVDGAGNVVQRVRSTEQGNYRFKNVAKGGYKIRASKAGWDKQELDVETAPAKAPAKANMEMTKKKK